VVEYLAGHGLPNGTMGKPRLGGSPKH